MAKIRSSLIHASCCLLIFVLGTFLYPRSVNAFLLFRCCKSPDDCKSENTRGLMGNNSLESKNDDFDEMIRFCLEKGLSVKISKLEEHGGQSVVIKKLSDLETDALEKGGMTYTGYINFIHKNKYHILSKGDTLLHPANLRRLNIPEEYRGETLPLYLDFLTKGKMYQLNLEQQRVIFSRPPGEIVLYFKRLDELFNIKLKKAVESKLDCHQRPMGFEEEEFNKFAKDMPTIIRFMQNQEKFQAKQSAHHSSSSKK